MPSARSSAIVAPSITRDAAFASGVPVALDTNGTVRDARGLASSTYSTSPASANWMFSSPRTPRPRVDWVDARILSISAEPSVIGGSAQDESPSASRPPRCAPSPRRGTARSRRTARPRDLDRVVQETVHQHRVRPELAPFPSRCRAAVQLSRVVHDLHARPPSTYDGRTSTGNRISAAACRLVGRHRGAVLGCRQVRVREHLAERAALLGQMDRLRRGADDRYTGVGEPLRQAERVCPPSCTITPATGPAPSRHTRP